MSFRMSPASCGPFCFSLSVLRVDILSATAHSLLSSCHWNMEWLKIDGHSSRNMGTRVVEFCYNTVNHYGDVIMSMTASQITSLAIVYSTVYSGADQRKHQTSLSLAFVRAIHWWPVNSPHKGPVSRKKIHLMLVGTKYGYSMCS